MMDVVKLDAALTDAIYHISNGEDSGISTGIAPLGDLLGGLAPGNLYIIGGRTGQGKSALAVQIACNVSSAGKTVLYVSMEMTTRQLVTRLLSSTALVKYTTLRDGAYSNHEWLRVVDAAEKIKELPLCICDNSGLDCSDIAGMIEDCKPDIVFVDYLGLIQGYGGDRRVEVDRIAYGLKNIAKKYNVPVVALSQVRRAALGADESKPPSLSDLRDSGAVEQAADAVIFVHRESMEDTASEIIVAKNRHGETGVIHAEWYGNLLTFIFEEEKN